jgi:NDP-sugar pyrophosphorylase family protein
MDLTAAMKAMVLCAGYGTRLGQLTREIPKPMLSIGDAPLLAYILGNLKRHGFTDIAINLHFKPEMIRDYFGDGTHAGLTLAYSFEPELLGTAGGLKNVEQFFRDEKEFLVHYGDILTNQDFTAMLECHREKDALATLLLHQRNKSNSIVTLDDQNRIISFLERPDEAGREGHTSRWVNSGICICHPEILNSIPPRTGSDLPRDIFPKLVDTGRLFGFPLTGYRCAIDSPERLAQANGKIQESSFAVVPLMDWHDSR